MQRAYPTDNLLENNINYWNQDFRRTDVGTRWRESWSITNKITVNENVHLIQYKLMYGMYYTRYIIHKFYSTTRSHVLSVKLLMTQ